MSTLARDPHVDALDRAVDRLRDLADGYAIDHPERSPIEAARDRLASYALAARNLAAAGVSTERLAELVERGWHDAARVFEAARVPEHAP